jgi:hypothetical protein|tara:strand:+ start:1837 stop:2133 length:297 start_codon:yes stop_codon:yes gene_type:complete
MINSTVRLPITKECELVLFEGVSVALTTTSDGFDTPETLQDKESPGPVVTLFVNGNLYGESLVDVSWQYLIELMLQVSRGDLSEFMNYEDDEIELRIN